MRDDEEAPPGWTFEAEELSNGHWWVIGRDFHGHQVERHGSPDPGPVLSEAKAAAWWVQHQIEARDVAQR